MTSGLASTIAGNAAVGICVRWPTCPKRMPCRIYNNGMAPGGFGYLVVAGVYVMNEYFKRPLVRMAVGPIAAIAVGILVNILAAVGLFAIPA